MKNHSISLECGIKGKNGKIVGGNEAGVNEYPWQALLFRNDFAVGCGGTLMNERWVMTAGHCVEG